MSLTALVSWLSLAVGVATAAWIAVDVIRRPQPMAVMNVVWPVCGLFGGPVLLWFYLRNGRAAPGGTRHHGHHHGGGDDGPPSAVSVSKGALHCGAGCTLGDLIAETLAAVAPAVLVPFGWPGFWPHRIFAAWGLDFVIAFALGIAFQYAAIVPMRNLSPGRGLWEAVKADTLSLISWQVGMYGFMALVRFLIVGAPLSAATPQFWFAMQFAMGAGFLTAWPTNRMLIAAGIKEAM